MTLTVHMSGCIDRDRVLPHLVDAIVSVALFWCILGGFPSLVVADLNNMGTCSYNRSVRHFECSDAIKMRDEILFDFYMGLSHMHNQNTIQTKTVVTES